MTNKQKNYEIGYRDGMASKLFKPERSKFAGYSDGWNDGDSARPILDSDLPILELDLPTLETNDPAVTINPEVADNLRHAMQEQAKWYRWFMWSFWLDIITQVVGIISKVLGFIAQ